MWSKIVARVTLTATHTKPVQLGPGTPTFQPTGKKLSWHDIGIWRVSDGKFVEHWDQSDLLGSCAPAARRLKLESRSTAHIALPLFHRCCLLKPTR